ncbi:MAG: hypothetical protein ABI743_06700 [bacterium]
MIQRLALLALASLALLAAPGCNSGGEITLIDVTANGQPFVDGGTPISVSEGDTVSLRIRVTGGSAPLTYEWEIDDDAGVLTDPNDESTDWELPAVLADADYDATVTVTDSSGKTLDASVTIRVE